MWDSTAIARTHERGRKCGLARAGGVREGHHLVHVADLELTGDELMLVTWRCFLPLSLWVAVRGINAWADPPPPSTAARGHGWGVPSIGLVIELEGLRVRRSPARRSPFSSVHSPLRRGSFPLAM